jgi:hypothetical protein
MVIRVVCDIPQETVDTWGPSRGHDTLFGIQWLTVLVYYHDQGVPHCG